MIVLQDLQERLSRLKTTFSIKSEFFSREKEDADKVTEETEACLLQLQQVIDVLSRVAELSRRDTIDKIEQLISFALQNIFREADYKFFIKSTEQKNGVIFSFLLQEAGLPPYPIHEAVGGGVGNVISTFLAIIVSVLQNPKGRRFFVLDERFKHVSSDNQERIAETLRFFSERLNCQFLIISHNKEIIKAGDKIYNFTKVKGATKAKEIQRVIADE